MSKAKTQKASPDEILKLLEAGEVVRIPLKAFPDFMMGVSKDFKIKARYNKKEALLFTEETERRLDAEAQAYQAKESNRSLKP